MQVFLAWPRDVVTHWARRRFACCVLDADGTFARSKSLHKMSRVNRLGTRQWHQAAACGGQRRRVRAGRGRGRGKGRAGGPQGWCGNGGVYSAPETAKVQQMLGKAAPGESSNNGARTGLFQSPGFGPGPRPLANPVFRCALRLYAQPLETRHETHTRPVASLRPRRLTLLPRPLHTRRNCRPQCGRAGAV